MGEKEPKNAEKEKEKKIKKELNRLIKIINGISPERHEVAKALVEELAFMKVTLEECREVVNREGIIETFEQGKQRFLREHPATKVYSTLINRYVAACKQLIDLLPAAEVSKAEDELLKFIKEAKR